MVNVNFHLILLAKDARSFYDAYVELSEARGSFFSSTTALNEKSGSSSHKPDFSSPAFMSLAFSLELHIKLLLKITGVNKKGHDPVKLIKALPQKEIDLLTQSNHLYPEYQGDRFFPELSRISNFFMRVRYYYEDLRPMKMSPWLSIGIIKTIQERVGQLVPYVKYELGFSE